LNQWRYCKPVIQDGFFIRRSTLAAVPRKRSSRVSEIDNIEPEVPDKWKAGMQAKFTRRQLFSGKR
jgi:hypothetical protein